MGNWEEIEDPKRIGLESFGGLCRIVGSQPSVRVEGILYYHKGNSHNSRAHTIIYRSEQRQGKWSQNIPDILEITDEILPHDKAIEKCWKYTK